MRTNSISRELRQRDLDRQDEVVLRSIDDHRTGVESGCAKCGSPGATHLNTAGLVCADCCQCPVCTDDSDVDDDLLEKWRAFIVSLSPFGGDRGA